MKGSKYPLEVLFKALSDRTRLRILNMVADRELCVCYFTELLGLSQPKVSRHLAYLRRGGIVAARRDGKWMHYSLRVPSDIVAANILRQALMQMKGMPEMQRDRERLDRACCDPARYVLIRNAPQPRITAESR
jgi:ArsR family transcriptional regulator